MGYKNLTDFIHTLEITGELVKVKEYVSPELEISEITDRVVKNRGKALLFENSGTDFPVLINAFGSGKRICMALGVRELDEITRQIDELFRKVSAGKQGFLDKLRMLPLLNELASWMPHTVRGRGACQEIVMPTPDMSRLPVLTCWPHDGGPFVTLPVVHSTDPNTGVRNVGMYRMQVFGPDLTGMHWHLHKNSARHYHEYKKLGLRMPVSVTLGGDPVYTYAATAPLPDGIDEYILAGFLRKKKVTMVKCLTNDLEVPQDVDFVIEGYIDPSEELISEGPFGDHTGFYSLPEYFPKFHITCITHRKNAVYPATIVGIPPQEDAWIGKATERIFLSPLRLTMQPEIIDMHMPVEGVMHNLVIIKIKKQYDGQAEKTINGLWGAGQMMFAKLIIAVDEHTDIFNYNEIARKVSERVDINQNIIYSKGPADILDHAAEKYAYSGKIGIDATGEVHAGEMPVIIEAEKILKEIPEIKQVNDTLSSENISFVIISLEKNKINHIKELTMSFLENKLISGVKCLVFVDMQVDVYDLKDVAWLVLNNMDPSRDIFIHEGVMIVDGTHKTKEFDGFDRPWPNVIVSDDATIKAVDEKWPRLGLGDFIESPSLKYKKLLWPGKAKAEN
ncbi:MAG TPA: menaquinone biosynthesis decarboxylase [Bacteroidales bacterium]|nr:menaquinone biosynthesis decarboxylase [Bacteroidales bacterium]